MQLRKYFAATFAALLLTGASVVNAAIPLTPIDVTWNPSATPISNAPAFTFDNIVLNTYLTIDVTGGTTFTDTGFLKLAIFTNDGLPTSVPNAGFPSGTPYSLYVQFTGTGTQTAGVPSTGSFTALTYSLIGAPGVTTFSQAANGSFTAVNAGPAITLATGSLLSPGTNSLTVDPGTGLLLPAAEVTASFIPNPAFAGFFVNPPATTQLTVTAAFTSTGTVVSQSTTGNTTRLSVNGGGGNATLAVAAIPEPDTYGMLLAGLGLIGFIARRKSKRETA
ncbi:MAG: hypothetical protein JWN94_2227 [Betaproteobacteria bacterium]|nr:hypothetical protein [Betaproteobacteria bacterium]